eukprot:8454026-Lingulodinium_polyedra.AAC.1
MAKCKDGHQQSRLRGGEGVAPVVARHIFAHGSILDELRKFGDATGSSVCYCRAPSNSVFAIVQ